MQDPDGVLDVRVCARLSSGIALFGTIPGLLAKPNWALFVLYWPIAYALVWATWDQFIDAWRSLASTKVLRTSSNQPVPEDNVGAVVAAMQKARTGLVIGAILLSLVSSLLHWLIGDKRQARKY